MLKKQVFFWSVLAACSVNAEPCVKHRDGELDNGDYAYSCMKFSRKEIDNAKKYGLQLASPSTLIFRQLHKQGWKIDWEYLDIIARERPDKEMLICGEGYDAVCTSAFRKAEHVLVLTFSGTNAGYPLISVQRDDPSSSADSTFSR